ncbi:hypothetical protein C8R45DRAFT_934268 [Mycena sanguinolenta]|nr:hypothetical protein C8R45DRAFT_934268 [Mycena sanguinolenta]
MSSFGSCSAKGCKYSDMVQYGKPEHHAFLARQPIIPRKHWSLFPSHLLNIAPMVLVQLPLVKARLLLADPPSTSGPDMPIALNPDQVISSHSEVVADWGVIQFPSSSREPGIRQGQNGHFGEVGEGWSAGLNRGNNEGNARCLHWLNIYRKSRVALDQCINSVCNNVMDFKIKVSQETIDTVRNLYCPKDHEKIQPTQTLNAAQNFLVHSNLTQGKADPFAANSENSKTQPRRNVLSW